MRNGQEKINHKKVFITIIGMVLILLFVVNSSKLLKKTSEKTTVFEGSLSYEEPVEAFVIRDEVVLQGENSENGLVQILADGERAAMNQSVFRYYSNVEDKNSLVIQTITKVFNETTNQNKEVFVSKGGTYAGKIPNAVATGICMRSGDPAPDYIKPGHGSAHQPDEFISIEGFIKGIKLRLIV